MQLTMSWDPYSSFVFCLAYSKRIPLGGLHHREIKSFVLSFFRARPSTPAKISSWVAGLHPRDHVPVLVDLMLVGLYLDLFILALSDWS